VIDNDHWFFSTRWALVILFIEVVLEVKAVLELKLYIVDPSLPIIQPTAD
jgi:hypothetical protein